MRAWSLGRFYIALLALITIVMFGTIGYMVIEGWSVMDSVFMTIITISTVGYSEIHELSSGGELFSIVLIISGVGIMFYTVTLLAAYVVEGYVGSTWGRHRMKDQIKNLKEHYIICGYGRVGQEVVSNLKLEGVPFVVVEVDPNACDKALQGDCLCVQGDVTSDTVLEEAGIEKAGVLIAAVGNDVDNVFVTLSAREIRPDIFIAARASADDSEKKLRRAGADRVIFPQRLGGRHMAVVAMHPRVVDFVDTIVFSHDQELSLQDILITADSSVAGMTIQEGQGRCGGGSILAMKKKDGPLIAKPPMEMILEAGDEVVVIGTKEQLRILQGSHS